MPSLASHQVHDGLPLHCSALTPVPNRHPSLPHVHRYEDAYTNPGHPFACGITLDRIGAFTVDDAGREAFVTNNPLQMLRKVCAPARLQCSAEYPLLLEHLGACQGCLTRLPTDPNRCRPFPAALAPCYAGADAAPHRVLL